MSSTTVLATRCISAIWLAHSLPRNPAATSSWTVTGSWPHKRITSRLRDTSLVLQGNQQVRPGGNDSDLDAGILANRSDEHAGAGHYLEPGREITRRRLWVHQKVLAAGILGRARLTRRSGSGVFYGWWMVGGLSITELVCWGTLAYAFSVFVVPMHAELGWSPVQLNGAYTTGVAMSGLVAIPVGRWLQHHGARVLMSTGSLLATAALLGWSQVDSLPVFYAIFAVIGLAMAATFYEPAFAVTATWFVRHRPQAVLALTSAGGLASTVFIPITGTLIGELGWRTALISLAVIVGLITVPIHALVLRRQPGDLGLLPDGDTTPRSANPMAIPQHPAMHDSSTVLRLRSFRWLTLSMVASTAGKLAVTVILVAYLISRGYALSHATPIAGAVGLFQVIGRVGSTWLRRRIPEHRTAIVLFTAQALALPLPLLTIGRSVAASVSIVVLVIFFGLAYGLPELLRGTIVADYYGPDHYARINGVMSTCIVAGRALGPLLAGIAGTILHTDAATLPAAALLALTSAYALHRAHHAHQTEQTTPAGNPS